MIRLPRGSTIEVTVDDSSTHSYPREAVSVEQQMKAVIVSDPETGIRIASYPFVAHRSEAQSIRFTGPRHDFTVRGTYATD